MSKKVFNFVVILLLIVFISNFASPILNKSSSFQKVYAKSEDLMTDIAQLEKDLSQDPPTLNDWRFRIVFALSPAGKNYNDLCEQAITYRKLASKMLAEAKKNIDNNDLVNATKHYRQALLFYLSSSKLLSTASQVAAGAIVDAQAILDGVRKGCEAAIAFGLKFVAPDWLAVLISDSFNMALEVIVAKSEGNTLSDTIKEGAIRDGLSLLFDGFSKYLNAKLGIYDLSEVYKDSNWTQNCSLLEQLKYYVSSDKTLIPSLISKLTEKGIDIASSKKIVDFFLSSLDSINSGSAGGGMGGGGGGGGGGGSWGQSLDKVQLSSPQNALVLQPGNITFSWNSVNNATKYEFILYNSFGQIMQDTVVSEFSTSITRTFGTDGTFTWTVKALDDYDNWGPWSDTWSLIIRNTSTQPYFKVLVDKGCGSTYKIGDVIKISGKSNITANGTLYSYWSDGSVKTYPAPFTANQTVSLVSSPLDGATGLRRYKVVVNYQGQTYESNECSINVANTAGTKPGSFTLTATPECSGTTSQIRLNWTNSSGVSTYNVYRDNSLYASGLTGTQYINSGNITPGTNYSYYVIAANSYGTTASNIVQATAVTCGGIYIGASVKTTANVNVRSGPGLSYSTIVTLPPNVYGTVIGGPSNSDGYVWWYCRWSYNGTTYTGWSVENYISP